MSLPIKKIFYLITSLVISAPTPALALRYTGTFDWVNLGIYTEPSSSSLNPNNLVLKVPNAEFSSEWRPNLNLEVVKNKLSLVANPRIRLIVNKHKVGKDWKREETEVLAFWNAAYVSASFPKGAQFNYGIQNYEWGPAELISPSNRIFQKPGYLKGLYFESHGEQLARLNITYNKNASLVFLALTEKTTSHESVLPSLQKEREFERQGAVKFEYASDSGEQLVGVVSGAAEKSKPYGGLYFSVKAGGFSLLYDGVAMRRGKILYPNRGVSPSYFEARNESTFAHVHVPGVRYEFENGNDVRVEYYHNSAGYNAQDIKDSVAVAKDISPLSVTNAVAYANPGLFLLAKQYIYASLRFPEAVFDDKLSFSLRHLYSLSDKSSHSLASLNVPVTDAFELFSTGLYAGGEEDRELTRIFRWQAIVGSRYTW